MVFMYLVLYTVEPLLKKCLWLTIHRNTFCIKCLKYGGITVQMGSDKWKLGLELDLLSN